MSILKLSDKEIQEKFWEKTPLSILRQNAEEFRQEVIWLITSNKRFIIRKKYKLLNDCSLYHQARVYDAFSDDKWAIECLKKSIARWEKIEKSLRYLNILVSKAWIDLKQVLWEIREIFLENWRMIFRKWESLELTAVFTQWIEHLKWDKNSSHVVMLWEKDSDIEYANGKCVFLCTRYEDANSYESWWHYAALEELDDDIKTKRVIFTWINTKWELEFREDRSISKEEISIPMSNNWIYTISVSDAQELVREKPNYYDDEIWDTVLVWENWSSEVIIIWYDEHHPQTVLKQIKIELDKWFIWDASDLMYWLEKWSPERKEAEKLIDDETTKQSHHLTWLIEQWILPIW